jgi:penicillin-binding protein-related factor A (putative recombinase)
MPMGKRESGIQRRTADLLNREFQQIVVRIKHGTAFAVVGDPDIYGCLKGRFFAFEVKNEKGQLTKIQQHRLQEFESAGALVGAIREPDDAAWFLNIVLKGRK